MMFNRTRTHLPHAERLAVHMGNISTLERVTLLGALRNLFLMVAGAAIVLAVYLFLT